MKILIPTQLQKITKSAELDMNSHTIDELISDLIFRFPVLKERLVNDNGQINKFLLVFVNDRDIRFLDGQKTKLIKDDVVSIIPSIAGG